MTSICTSPYLENCLVLELLNNRELLLRQARRIVGSAEAAEDVLHDTALKCMSRTLSETPQRPLVYVSRMVRNSSIDYLRRQQRKQMVELNSETATEMYGSERDSGLTRLELRDELRLVSDAVSKLPARTRDAFVRHRLSMVPQKQIAEELQVSRALVCCMIKEADMACRAARLN